jgi:endo-1,4-beta-xylanase
LNSAAFFHPEGELAVLDGAQFGRATAENAMKWSSLEATRGEYTFEGADAFVALAELFDMEIHGHVLLWHQQVPDWVFQADDGGEIDRAQLLGRLDDHMALMAERYGDRVAYWDVVNEAFLDDGGLRETPWRRILGDDYIADVFAMADRHFPDAKLVYNDFNMYQEGKRDAVVRMVHELDDAGVRIDAVGLQSHNHLFWPPLDLVDAALSAYADAGVEVLITELDIDVLPGENARDENGALVDPDPYVECVPESVDALIAERWGGLMELYVRHAEHITSVTVWGLYDGQSWLNAGRSNHALLFDRRLRPKSNYVRVIEAAGD